MRTRMWRAMTEVRRGMQDAVNKISPQKWKPWIVKEQQNLHAAISSNLDQFAHDKFSRLGPQMNPFLLVPVLCQKQHVSTVAGN